MEKVPTNKNLLFVFLLFFNSHMRALRARGVRRSFLLFVLLLGLGVLVALRQGAV